jgi:predicted metal-dependent hydrolase
VSQRTAMTPAQRLERALARQAGQPVRVTLTRNRRRLVSVRRERSHIDVRLHEALVEAPATVRRAVARFVLEGCKDSARLIREHLKAAVPPAPPRPVPLVLEGQHHHLGKLLKEVARRLPRRPLPSITWGHQRRPGRRTVRLGTYDPERGLIRIHRVLDHPKVPAAVVRHVIYHELLHHVLGVKDRPHGPRFMALEQRCPDLPAAKVWIKGQLPRRLAAARRSAPG